MRPRERHLRALTAVLTAAVLCLASGCAGSDVPASGTSTAALPSTVNDAPAQQDPGQFASFIGQEARVDQSDYEDDDYFIMQPGGTLTWFSYIIGGHRYEQHDYQSKPVNRDSLIRACRDWIAKSRHQQKAA